MSQQPITTKALHWFAELSMDDQCSAALKIGASAVHNLTIRDIIELYATKPRDNSDNIETTHG